ncbi:MAG: DUF2934 domain-containing protein [Rhodospirillaceae bacterium]
MIANDSSGVTEVARGVTAVAGIDDDLSVLDQDARALAEAADQLSLAETPEQLGEALAHNLQVWVAIKSIVGAKRNPLPTEVRHNLDLLAAYVIRTILGPEGGRITISAIETMIRINLHIAEGLVRSQRNRLVRDRAYHIWEDQGRPSGREMENWVQAEREIQALLAES